MVPTVTHETSRYDTLGDARVEFLHRTGYAISRLVITRIDSAGKVFDVSETLGNALGAGVSDLYYLRTEQSPY